MIKQSTSAELNSLAKSFEASELEQRLEYKWGVQCTQVETSCSNDGCYQEREIETRCE